MTRNNSSSSIPIPDDSNSVLTLQILLQSRSTSHQQTFPDKISMNSKDMKSLSLKIGATVAITADSGHSFLLSAWPSKTLTQGTASLHRMWWPNFSHSDTAKRRHRITSDISR